MMTGLQFKLNTNLLYLIFIFLLFGPNEWGQSKGKIIFLNTTHNFGVLKEGDVVTYTFKFRNKGRKAVRVTGANAACVCTSLLYPHKKIKPGETGFIKVRFNSDKLPGKFYKRIIISLDTKPYTIPLYITGVVLPKPLKGTDVARIGGLSFSERTISMGNVSQGRKVNKIITIQNASTYPVLVDSIQKPEDIHITYPKFKIMTGERLKLNIRLNPIHENVNHSFYEPITFFTDDSTQPQKKLYISAYILPHKEKKVEGPAIDFENNLKNLGDVIQNDTLNIPFHFKNTGNRPLTIQNMTTSCGCTTAQIKKQTYQPGETGTIHVVINTDGKFGFIEKEIHVFSDAANDPDHQLILEFNVVKHPSIKLMLGKVKKDKILIFKGKCRSCHVDPGIGKKGVALYDASCQMCHGGVNRKRDKYYPGIRLDKKYLESISRRSLFKMIAEGTPDVRKKQMMPGFLNKDGGPLTETQVSSLVNYLKSIQSTH